MYELALRRATSARINRQTEKGRSRSETSEWETVVALKSKPMRQERERERPRRGRKTTEINHLFLLACLSVYNKIHIYLWNDLFSYYLYTLNGRTHTPHTHMTGG